MVHSGWVANQSKHGEVAASSFPCEYLVKTLMSSQNSGFSPLPKDKPLKILEIGSFGGNNLRFLWEFGFKDIYGIEVSDSLVEMCKKRVLKFTNNEIDTNNIVLGNNLNIPFPDSYFDLIISINTIHYSYGKDVERALNFWSNKLKDSGRLFVQTAGPKHEYVLDSKR